MNIRRTRAIPVLATLFLIAVIAGGYLSVSKPKEYSATQFLMGTVVDVRLYGRNAEKAAREAFARMRQIEELMSVNVENSDVARINAAAGVEPVQVSPETFKVIETALQTAKASEGRFDPTIGPLVNAWGIGTEKARVPSPQEIAALRPLVNWQDVELDPKARTVFLKRPNMSLDLGGIAKGYAADETIAIFRSRGIKSAFVSLGGNVFVLGKKPDDTLWRVGIRDPFVLEGQPHMAVVTAADLTLVTSGTYERFFVRDGKRYHHLISPITGYPAESDLESATIVTDNSMLADSLSTAVFVLGKEKGKALIESMENVEAMLIDRNRRVWVSPGLKANVRLVNEEFRFE